MRQFSLPLTISSSSSSSSRRTSSKDHSVSKLDSDLAPPKFQSSNTPSSRSSRSNSFLAALTRSNPSPLVIATNLTKADDSLPSSPESAASPSNPHSLSNRFSWSRTDKLSAPWDDDDEILDAQSHSSSASSPIEHLLVPGDVVCHGGYLQSEPIQIVPIPHSSQEDVDQQLGEEFEVVRRLGAGSYAVVYLVREVLSRPQSDDDHSAVMGHMDDMDSSMDSGRSLNPVYGREYAIKCQSKANLEEGGLAAQLDEATIHQSLPPHPNIVTSHRTFETPSFLLLLLEYVPGEDLYYFLSRARDRYEMDPVETSAFTSCTPPTPGLLTTLNPNQLLSTSRLRLISSMFSQICDAVEFCHANGVYHRDIKPENLIVTDRWVTGRNGQRERKVVVKLSDFGLACTEAESSDMDCGSAPYMSYECRNNLSPQYRPRGADIWSLGIVLLNMLYHRNPWTDTADGACTSFGHFRRRPVAFLLQRFTGMKRPVAEFLANRVFCVLDNPMDDSPRVTAQEFGQWVKTLPHLLTPGGSSKRTPRAPAPQHEDHPLGGSMPPSHRPSSRNSSYSSIARPVAIRTPAVHELSLLEPTLEQSMDDLSIFYDPELDAGERPEFDSTGQKVAVPPLPTSTRFSALTSSLRSDKSHISALAPPSPTSATTPTVTKKSSIWRLGFGKSSTGPTERLSPASATTAAPVTSSVSADSNMSATASNVTSLIMGLNPADQPSSRSTTYSKGRQPRGPASHTSSKKARPPQGVENFMSPAYWSDPKAQPARVEGVTSSASSVKSGNWRSSLSSTSSLATSNSGFTRFSNNSARSVATAATSVSASSWRSGGGGKASSLSPPQQKTITPATLPRNIRMVKHRVPREDGDLEDDEESKREIYGSPPLKQPRFKHSRDSSHLHTITERPRGMFNSSNEDLTKGHVDADPFSDDDHDDASGRKKVQKGQINALAKMLSALRR